MFAAARALSAETCELCGGKGDPLADADGQPAGCRCSRCREPGAIVLARDWDWATFEDYPQAVSPGQSPEEGWQSCPRLETLYAKPIRQLMATEHEDDVMSLWGLGFGLGRPHPGSLHRAQARGGRAAFGRIGRRLQLFLSSVITRGQTVVVSYADPTPGDDDVALQDLAGNDLASFTATATNNSAVEPVPALPLTGGGRAAEPRRPGGGALMARLVGDGNGVVG